VDLPIENGDFSIVMLVHQRVFLTTCDLRIVTARVSPSQKAGVSHAGQTPTASYCQFATQTISIKIFCEYMCIYIIYNIYNIIYIYIYTYPDAEWEYLPACGLFLG